MSARLVFGAAALGAAALVLASVLTVRAGGESATAEAAGVAGAAETQALLAGIPQQGIALGSPAAPVTLVEYADMQCPYCARWSQDAFPALVRDYVRPGRLRIVFRGLAFLGPESETALRAVLAAGDRDRLWNVSHLLFANQGPENGGWVTDALLRDVGDAVPGLGGEQLLERGDDRRVAEETAAAVVAARAAGIPGTPSFELGPTGGRLELLALDSLDAAPFRARIDALLAG